MREIYRNDFESVRDYFMANITMPLRDNHTYALYGNNYVYPLIIKQDQNYFLLPPSLINNYDQMINQYFCFYFLSS